VTGPPRLVPSWPHDPPDPRVLVLPGHDDAISTCRFAVAGDRLVTGDRSGRLLVRDLPSGAVRADLRLPASTGHLRGSWRSAAVPRPPVKCRSSSGRVPVR
jgi:hypothetical protein